MQRRDRAPGALASSSRRACAARSGAAAARSALACVRSTRLLARAGAPQGERLLPADRRRRRRARRCAGTSRCATSTPRIDLDADGDGKLTWGEVTAAWPRDRGLCAAAAAHRRLPAARRPAAALERRNDGAYAVLICRSTARSPRRRRSRYSLLRDVDPTHRGIAKIAAPGPAARVARARADADDAGRCRDRVAGSERVGDPGARRVVADGAAGSDAGRRRGGSSSREGVRHILTGYDHVLFLLCLLLPSVMRRTPPGWQPVERLVAGGVAGGRHRLGVHGRPLDHARPGGAEARSRCRRRSSSRRSR